MDRHHAIGVDRLGCVQVRGFRFGRQMWRDEANTFDGWPTMREPHDLVAVQIVLRGPPSPMAFDTCRRVDENTIEIEQHCVALQFCHAHRTTIIGFLFLHTLR